LLGGLFIVTNANVQATQDGSQAQLPVWILGAVSNVTASDAAARQTASTSGRLFVFILWSTVYTST